jgi:hypothetical protein
MRTPEHIQDLARLIAIARERKEDAPRTLQIYASELEMLRREQLRFAFTIGCNMHGTPTQFHGIDFEVIGCLHRTVQGNLTAVATDGRISVTEHCLCCGSQRSGTIDGSKTEYGAWNP